MLWHVSEFHSFLGLNNPLFARFAYSFRLAHLSDNITLILFSQLISILILKVV